MRTTPNIRNTVAIAVAVMALAITMAPIDAWSAEQSAGAATIVVDNPYGLEALWATGDWVAKGTLGILFLMSLGTW